MTFFEFIKDIIDSSKERIKTPITGSFILAFLAYNWRPLLILISSNKPIEDKIEQIDSNYCGIDSILIPLAIAIGYVLLVPYIMMGLESLTGFALTGRKKHQNKQLFTDLQLMEGLLQQEFKNQQIKSGNVEITALNNTNKHLNEKVEELVAQLETERTTHNRIMEQSKVNEQTLQKQINNLRHPNHFTEQATETLDLVALVSILNEMKRDDLINFTKYYDAYYEGNYKDADKVLNDIILDEFLKHQLIIHSPRGGYRPSEKATAFYKFMQDGKNK